MPLCYQFLQMSTVFSRLLLFVRSNGLGLPGFQYQWSKTYAGKPGCMARAAAKPGKCLRFPRPHRGRSPAHDRRPTGGRRAADGRNGAAEAVSNGLPQGTHLIPITDRQGCRTLFCADLLAFLWQPNHGVRGPQPDAPGQPVRPGLRRRPRPHTSARSAPRYPPGHGHGTCRC